jgi:hypothetical protein
MVTVFSFQHMALEMNVCPQELLEQIHTKIVRSGIYERIEQQGQVKAISRTARKVSMTHETDKVVQEKVFKVLLKRLKAGLIRGVTTEQGLKSVIGKHFAQRRRNLDRMDDLFSKNNVTKTQRANGGNW